MGLCLFQMALPEFGQILLLASEVLTCFPHSQNNPYSKYNWFVDSVAVDSKDSLKAQDIHLAIMVYRLVRDSNLRSPRTQLDFSLKPIHMHKVCP